MSQNRRDSAANRRLRFEQFEERLVMSGQAIAPAIIDLLPEMELAAPAITGQDVIWQSSGTLENVAARAASYAAQFGLDGSGQTVAIIDSGIAWDHTAFGGGFGDGHHVVGGWDFAENDANPYDDGPAGYHGSHVAGIIGSQDEQYRGVSSGADLVSLRVFDDQGMGNLDWVEQALGWVAEHQHDFRFPITTVNLSLGTGWDPETTPGWGQLEDEFARLKLDGIFISVAAGNGFRTLGQTGLSYPAASDQVVPVASHDASGQLSDYSQRDSNVLVAPGEMLRSPVPNHLFGGTRTDQFLASSGTSMAAPYVAGASAILRQANEFMGVTDINQDLLYQQFKQTADRMYDQVTGRYYDRVNLGAALEHIIADHHASQLDSASDVGRLIQGDQISGTIGRLDDVDAFRFTATQTGKLQLTWNATHQLKPELEFPGQSVRIDGNVVEFNVVAGQQYGLRISTSAGTGHYTVDIAYQAQPDSMSLGAVVDHRIDHLTVDGERLFQMTATRNGWLTVQTQANASATPLSMEVFDYQMNRLTSGQSSAGQLRLDTQVQAGQTYWIRVANGGHPQSFDLRVTNLVEQTGDRLIVHGTNGNDTLSVQDQEQLQIQINDITYQFDRDAISDIRVIGHLGQDQFFATLSDANDQVVTGKGRVFIGNQHFRLNALEIATATLDGKGGWDTVTMRDSAGKDWLTTGYHHPWASGFWTALAGNGFESRATGFEIIAVDSTGSGDVAILEGSAGNDQFTSLANRATLRIDSTTILASGFDSVTVFGGGGHDRANLFAGASSDRFSLSPRVGQLLGEDRQVRVQGFEQITAVTSIAGSAIELADSRGDDLLYHRDGVTTISGDNFRLVAHGFTATDVRSVGGSDLAQVFGTTGNDRLIADQSVSFELDQSILRIEAFENVGFLAEQGGFDQATIIGSDGTDRLWADSNTVRISNQQLGTLRVVGMERVTVDLRQGVDHAYLQGSSGRDRLTVGYNESELETTLRLLHLTNVEQLTFDGNGGRDSVKLAGPIDLLSAVGDNARAVMADHTTQLNGISFMDANNVDQAMADYALDSADFLYLLRGTWNH